MSSAVYLPFLAFLSTQACAMEPMDSIDVAVYSLRYVYKTTG